MKEEITAPHPDGQRLLFLRRHYIKFLLIFFLLFGFYLRAYHIDYPSVGYHNMKENNYLSITTNYYKKGLSIHREVFFYGSEDPPYHEEYPQLPIIPYVGYFLWNVFGVSFWIMRLQIILFSLGTVVLAFFLTKRLTQEPNLSLLTAGVMTILPINVFYGRNIQPESPALFFMMLFFLLFLRWKESPSFRKSFFAGLTLAVIGLYKVSFLVPCVAVLAIFPYRQLFEDIKTKNFMPYIGYLSFLVLPVFILLVALSNVHASLLKGTAHRIRFLEFLDPAYWRTNYPFFENFWIGNYTSFLGLIFVLGVMVLFIKKSTFRKFFTVYLFSIVIYLMVFSSFFKGHNYYQMPYVYLVAFCIANALLAFFSF
ncbi:MAG TPA: phospholipid carrier-dependent glycosyltransferase, partial [Nitrospirae bacterium]|nr:phospholipid carrier-dependent glycosyltransferase [Nitrospirota bacterium]